MYSWIRWSFAILKFLKREIYLPAESNNASSCRVSINWRVSDENYITLCDVVPSKVDFRKTQQFYGWENSSESVGWTWNRSFRVVQEDHWTFRCQFRPIDPGSLVHVSWCGFVLVLAWQKKSWGQWGKTRVVVNIWLVSKFMAAFLHMFANCGGNRETVPRVLRKEMKSGHLA